MTTDLVIRTQDYQDQLGLFGLTAFMSRRGNCYDNAPMERLAAR